MKNTQKCPKCACKRILKIPSFKGDTANQIFIKLGWLKYIRIYPARYLCEGCGYIEEWVENKADLATVVKNKSKLFGL
jgi:predicted nucleic-acid-binding Zn-ribbon protein